jgi:protein TonB
VLVLKNGKVGQLKLKQSSGFARLDQSALNAVRGWTYQPALKLSQPIDYWFVQPVVFNLNSIH